MNLTPADKKALIKAACEMPLDSGIAENVPDGTWIRMDSSLIVGLSLARRRIDFTGLETEDEARMAMLFLIEEACG